MQDGKSQQGKRRTRRKFCEEFKRDAVEMVVSSGRSIAEVAGELGVYDSALGNWVRQRQVDDGEREGLTADERQRLGEREQENAELGKERELLTRTITFWVTESTP
jgi:transposase-like protein